MPMLQKLSQHFAIVVGGLVALLAMTPVALPSDLVVDGTSAESYERSIRQMADTLDESDKEAFARGLMNMILMEYPPARGKQGFPLLMMMNNAMKAAHVTMSGRLLSEILERGRSLPKSPDNSAPVGDPDPSEAIRECLQRKVQISNVQIKSNTFQRDISVDVTNGLDWAIAGIRVTYEAYSKGRSVAWAKDDFSLSISGGIEPGEMRTLTTTAAIANEAPETLIVKAKVLDVSDQFERQLIRDVRVIGWGDEKSDKHFRVGTGLC